MLALTVSRAFATAVVPPPITPPHPADPGTLSIDAFTSGVQATVFRNDGTQSGTVDALLTQIVVMYHSSDGTPVTFATFCIDLFHTVSPDQVYPVILRDMLDPFYVNGIRMAYVLDHFGASDLSGAPDQAAAVQIASGTSRSTITTRHSLGPTWMAPTAAVTRAFSVSTWAATLTHPASLPSSISIWLPRKAPRHPARGWTPVRQATA
jgi:hypothetical protein